jgi:tetratricopeptide (TPR) repeat protein
MKKGVVITIIVLAIGMVVYFFGYRSDYYTKSKSMEDTKKKIEELQKKALQAENDFKKDIQEAERIGVTYEKLGEKYLDLKDWTPAITSLEKAIEYGSSGAPVHYMLGVAYANRAMEIQEEADIEKAEFHYRRALTISPDHYPSRYGLAITLYSLKDEKDEGIKELNRVVSEKPEFYEAQFALARFHYETGNPSRSLGIYENLYDEIRDKPDSPRMKYFRKSCIDNISRLERELAAQRR